MNANGIIKAAGMLALPLIMLTGLAEVAQADPHGYSVPARGNQTTIVNVYNTTINNTYITNTYNVNSNNTGCVVRQPAAPQPTFYSGGHSAWGGRAPAPSWTPMSRGYGSQFRPPMMEHRNWGLNFSFSFGGFGR